jgi:hypothetical protein
MFLISYIEFVNFDKTLEEKLNDIVKQLARKSAIKDVCALLDMKSSKYSELLLIYIFC